MAKTEFYVRFDEDGKSAAQIEQRDRTYEAAKILRRAGFPCTVQEYFTGSSKRANAASIVLDMEEDDAR